MIGVDANVLLEVILQRTRAAQCEAVLANEEDKAISILTLDLVLYFAERDKLPLGPIKDFLQCFIWLPITDADATWAFAHYKGKDYEDALQVACTIRERCSRLVTLDADLAKKYQRYVPISLIR